MTRNEPKTLPRQRIEQRVRLNDLTSKLDLSPQVTRPKKVKPNKSGFNGWIFIGKLTVTTLILSVIGLGVVLVFMSVASLAYLVAPILVLATIGAVTLVVVKVILWSVR